MPQILLICRCFVILNCTFVAEVKHTTHKQQNFVASLFALFFCKSVPVGRRVDNPDLPIHTWYYQPGLLHLRDPGCLIVHWFNYSLFDNPTERLGYSFSLVPIQDTQDPKSTCSCSPQKSFVKVRVVFFFQSTIKLSLSESSTKQ